MARALTTPVSGRRCRPNLRIPRRGTAAVWLAASLCLPALAKEVNLGDVVDIDPFELPVSGEVEYIAPSPSDDKPTTFLLLRLTALADSDGDSVEVDLVYDVEGGLVYDVDRFELVPGKQYWTRPVAGDRVTLRYLDNDPYGQGGAEIGRIGRGTYDLFQLNPPIDDPEFSPNVGICDGGPSWENVAELPGGYTEELIKTRAKRVGLIVRANEEDMVVNSCSAAVIDPVLILTAGHCLDPVGEVETASFTLDFRTDSAGGAPADYAPWFYKLTRRLHWAWNPNQLADPDFGVAQINTTGAPIGEPYLKLHSGPVGIGDPLFAIHHPQGAPKKVSWKSGDPRCEVQDPSLWHRVEMRCDVDHGSSGSPLFNDDGDIVGVNIRGGCTDDDQDPDHNEAQSAFSVLTLLQQAPASETVDAVVVFDRSGSMRLTDMSGNLKIDEARKDAAKFFDLVRTDEDHQAGLVSFSSSAEVDYPLEEMTDSVRAELIDSVDELEADGNTSIGHGLEKAQDQLDNASGSNMPAILLMTDGLQNKAPWIEEVEDSLADTRLCAVGYGTEASLDGPLLTRLAHDHGGIYTRASDGLELLKYFVLCFGNIFETGSAADPFLVLPEDQQAAAPVEVPVCGETSLTVVIGWERPDTPLVLRLTSPAPAETPVDAETPGVTGSSGPTWAFLRLPLPLDGEQDGPWSVTVERAPVIIPEGGDFLTKPRVRFFLAAVVDGGPRLVPVPLPPLYSGDVLRPRVVLRDDSGRYYYGRVELDIEQPTEGAGNLLTVRGLGPPRTVDGDVLDPRVSTLLALEAERGGRLAGTTTTSIELFDDGVRDERAFEPDGQYGNVVEELLRTEGHYDFHARATYGELCQGRRETQWSVHVDVGVDPEASAVEIEDLGLREDGRRRVRVRLTPRDRYGNYVGPGRGDDLTVAGRPGSEPVGELVDSADGSYEQEVAWDPAVGEPPGLELSQPGRPPVDLPAEVPEADLRISKTASDLIVTAGDLVSYTIEVTNGGPDAVLGATVRDDLHPAFTGASWTCTPAPDCRTPSGMGGVDSRVDLAAGATVTFVVTGSLRADFLCATSNTAVVDPGRFVADPDLSNNRASAQIDVFPAGPGVRSCKTVSGAFVEGGLVTYTVRLLNPGPFPQPDNPGSEFVDDLPPELTLLAATASSGTIVTVGNTVRWDGSLPVLGTVTITLTARIADETLGETICNQGTVFSDPDSDGTNDLAVPTDDPGIPGTEDPTCFEVGGVLNIPTLSKQALLLLALCLLGFAWLLLRSRQKSLSPEEP